MSSTWFNLRAFSWHLMFGDDAGRWWKIALSKNGYHKAHNWPDGYFSIYT